MRGGGGGGLTVPHLNFKPFHVPISEGLLVLGLSSLLLGLGPYLQFY